VFHVVVMPPVSKALGEFLSSQRLALLAILNRLYSELTDHADRYRRHRDAEDPDLFNYDVYLFDGSNWHSFRFSVDDRQATGFLFVVAVRHRLGKG
jgi:hypothetical protein